MYSHSDVSWINPSTLGLTAPESPDMCGLYDGFEALSERNLSGRPVRYVFDFSRGGIDLSPEEAVDLASFFLELTPSRTVIALVQEPGAPERAGERIFRAVLKGGGFAICGFRTRQAAQIWLDGFVSDCDAKGLVCGPACPHALTTACPAMPDLVQAPNAQDGYE